MFDRLKGKLTKWVKKVRESSEEAEPEKAFVKEPEKEEIKEVFQSAKEKLQKIELNKKEFERYADELEFLLLENNTALEAVEEIRKKMEERLIGKRFLKKEIESEIKESLRDAIKDIFVEPFDLVERIKFSKKRPFVIIFFGINGVGKTTVMAKIAELLKENKISCVFAGADTFRAGSIEQLEKHGNKLGVRVIRHAYGSDPAAVGFDAIKHAKAHNIDVVLIDTAGRMHTEINLLREMEKICKVNNPDLKIFVGESITGNDAVVQAKNFNKYVGIDAIILSKADIDERGGTALSISSATKKPILYLGTGQNYKDLEKFDPDKFVKKLGL